MHIKNCYTLFLIFNLLSTLTVSQRFCLFGAQRVCIILVFNIICKISAYQGMCKKRFKISSLQNGKQVDLTP